jgi:acyl-CoA synthetase (AMP-forming)/AMP-acid ligase II
VSDANVASVVVPDDVGLTLGGFVGDIGSRHGAREALVFEGRRWTYAELEAEIRRCAKGLLAAGVVKGTRVGLLMGNRPEWIVSCWAAGMVGGVVIPISTFAGPEERDYVIRHSDTSLLIVQDALLKHRYVDDLDTQYPELAAGGRSPSLPFLRRVVELQTADRPSRFGTWDELLAGGEAIRDQELDAAAAAVAPSDDGVVIYTSGTTAQPKGVLHNQRTPVLQAWRVGDHLRCSPADRVASTYPFFWSAGFTLGMAATFALGACLVLQEWFDPAEALALIESERVTTLYAAPHQEAALAEHPDAASRDLTSLSKVNAASPLRPLAGIEGQAWGLPGAYGLSETFTFATSIASDDPWELRKELHGKPFPGVEVRIVDEAGAELPPGAYGEICVRGVTVMEGYYKVPREEVFDAQGFFHTRDAGAILADGNLHWTGRLSGLIKTGGANVSPVELELELARWGRLRTVMVVGVPHPTLGEAVVVCATLRVGEQVSEAEVRDYLKERLSSYKVPRRVLFVEESELSFTSSQQKVQLESLRARAVEHLVAEGADPAWTAFLSGTAVPATAV